ncbi:MAG TPA: isoprenylcysteine carboxylmethyltransferase family protein [Opitutales bacterium]|jgi:protein-S-isoprenylcysteine O-methyltransferase Ste14|nr:isoprenylcysteine carboxylmethyltransferase family protein [Opitutales bacterium]
MIYENIDRILWLGIIAYWIITWQGNKKTVQSANPRGRLIGFLFFIVFAYALYHADGWLKTRLLPDNDTMHLLGTVCTASGIAFAIWARVTLGRNWSANPTIKEGHELITQGPYRFVRHPIYTGLLLAMFGTFFLQNGLLRDLLFCLFIVFGLRTKSLIEEKFMFQTFPQSYPDYCRRTKAIIPYIW